MLPSGLYPIVPAIGAISPSEFARASSGSGHANHHCTRRSRACWGTIGANPFAPQTRTGFIEHEVNDVVRAVAAQECLRQRSQWRAAVRAMTRPPAAR